MASTIPFTQVVRWTHFDQTSLISRTLLHSLCGCIGVGKGVKNLIGYLMILVIHLMSYVSLSAAQRVGRGIGWLMWIRRTRGREVARVNLSLCYPDQTDAERSDMIHDTLLQNGIWLSVVSLCRT